MVAEEAPSEAIVLILHEDSYTSTRYSIPNVGAGCHVLLPDHGEKEGPGAVHDGNIWESPIAIIFTEGFDDKEEERMPRDSAHSVIRDPGRSGFANPGRIGKQRVEAAIAALERMSAIDL